MDFTKQPPVILSLCPGSLGLERGFARASEKLNWTHHKAAAYVEIESFICWNLVNQMEQGLLAPAPIHTNIKRFPFGLFRNKIHGIFGGYPCQPFSNAGLRKGVNDPRHLWPFIYRGIQTTRPVFCFFENVAGHLNLGFDEVSRDLRKVGYNVEAGIFTAEEVGAPHKRERLFILAIKHGVLQEHPDGIRSGRQNILSEFSWGRKIISGGKEILIGVDQVNPECGRLNKPWGQSESERLIKTGVAQGNAISERPRWQTNTRISVEFGKDGSGTEKRKGEGLAFADRKRFVYGQSQIDAAKRGEYSLCNITTNGQTGVGQADSCKIGFSGPLRNGELEGERFAKCNQSSAWPSRPGEKQYEWEEPRIIESEIFESGLGSSADGYNFREDLLRMYGNAVVEQTAEFAFLNLLMKHYENSATI